MQLPETVEIETRPNPSGAVIWLHGLGADGHDFEPIVPELKLPDSLGLRFVFPHARPRPVTLNGGMEMRAWYDIVSLDRDGPADAEGIRESSAQLQGLIERENERGIDSTNIVVAGFSQGGAIAIHNATRNSAKLAGLMALSTYMPLLSEFEADVAANRLAGNIELPVFMAHGSFDPVLPPEFGKSSAKALTAAGYSVDWHEYPMAHQVCLEEIRDIRNWLLSLYA